MLKKLQHQPPPAPASPPPPPAPAGPASPAVEPESVAQPVPSLHHISNIVRRRLQDHYGDLLDFRQVPEVEKVVHATMLEALEAERQSLPPSQQSYLLDYLLNDLLGYGPIEPLLWDESITEIMVNGPRQVYVERAGLLDETPVVFEDEDHLLRVINRIVLPLGRQVSDVAPMVNARLPNGFRVNVVIRPLAVDGPQLTIRKFSQTPFTVQDLIERETLTRQVAAFLKACVEARVNIVVSGGTGTGKTTLLNVLSAFIPHGERIVTIEDTAELQLKQRHVVRLECRPPDVSGRNEVTSRQLLINALRMRPDRIIVGEARGSEALDMLQAMNTGHDGSMTTIHSNSPRDSLRRIELMVLMSGIDLPLRAIREQVNSAIDMVVHLDRMQDGTRRVVKVTEVRGMEGEVITMTDLYAFELLGEKDGHIQGALRATGLRPGFVDKFQIHHVELLPALFSPISF